MNKTELIDAIAAGAELSKKDAKAALEATLAAISASLGVAVSGRGSVSPTHPDAAPPRLTTRLYLSDPT